MKAERIKVFSNDRKIDEEKTKIIDTQNKVSEIMSIYQSEGIKLTDDEYNLLIRSTFSSEKIEEIAFKKTQKLNRREQNEEYLNWIDDLNLYTKVFCNTGYVILSGDVYVSGGKVLIKEGAFGKIEERYTQYISDETSISLYNRHKELIKQANELKNEMNEHAETSIYTSNLFYFDAKGEAFVPILVNYGV